MENFELNADAVNETQEKKEQNLIPLVEAQNKQTMIEAGQNALQAGEQTFVPGAKFSTGHFGTPIMDPFNSNTIDGQL